MQEVIIRGHEKAGFVMTVEHLEELAKVISRHVEVEKRMREAAEEALGLIRGKNMVLHEYFLNYLLEDEKKHTDMLKGIEDLKRSYTRMDPQPNPFVCCLSPFRNSAWAFILPSCSIPPRFPPALPEMAASRAESPERRDK